MSDFFQRIFKKKYFDVGLDEKPKNQEEFISAIEAYFKKENLEFEFIERKKPAKIKHDGRIYTCKASMIGRYGWHLIFRED
ncbi:MAG: DUF4318 domain-containing protein [Sarcina sp.]